MKLGLLTVLFGANSHLVYVYTTRR